MIYGVAFHDIYHAGQVRLLRRLMEPEAQTAGQVQIWRKWRTMAGRSAAS